MLLSVIIPAYNEEDSIKEILELVAGVSPKKEIIVVNDASTDRTKSIIENFKDGVEAGHNSFPYLVNLKFVDKGQNGGKGSAIRAGLKYVEGDIVLIQDADLELDPQEYVRLLEPFKNPETAVVYGSRFRQEGVVRVHQTWHLFVNKFLTGFSNIFTGLYLTDVETCYKIFRSDIIQSFKIRSNRFGIDPELTALAARAVKKLGQPFYEMPISYNPRTRLEGKKIKAKDGLVVLWSIIYFNLFAK